VRNRGIKAIAFINITGVLMNYYENIVIIDAGLDEEGIAAAEKRIIETISKSGGEMIKVEKWGRRKLTYKINKREMGIYILFVFKAPAAAPAALEVLYKVFDPVFKFMIVKLGKKEIKALTDALQGKAAAEARVQEEARAAQAALNAPAPQVENTTAEKPAEAAPQG
jgi:small subunit ribosomal protein S6